MESITAYVISGITTLTLLLIAALIASSINFERGSRPRDAARRRIWYWVIAVLNPALIFPLSIGAACGFAVYLVLGFVLSKIYKNGKIGHWF
jgi:sulfoxide reductase heme-binding subunit YedZ